MKVGMKRVCKYRIYPSGSQERILIEWLDICRWVYNEALAARKNAWEQEQKRVSRYDTIKMLPEWKGQRPEIASVYSQVLQEVCTRVDLAFQAFFRRVKKGDKPGYPRFKGVGRYDSFTFPQSGFALADGKLRLSKVGDIKIVLHCPLAGKVKTLTVRRSATGKWYACFSCELEDPIILDSADSPVGIDVGLEKFAMLSTGERIENPRFFRKEEKSLARVQRRHAKKKTRKSKRVVAKVHERIANKRRDFAHQHSRRIVNEFDVICLEDLNVQGMVRNHSLAKSISDVAWSQFKQFIAYKAEGAGKRAILVDPRNTSKACSRCGILVEKSLSDRMHRCSCGLEIDRDLNAAYNILRLGLQSLGKIPRSRATLVAAE